MIGGWVSRRTATYVTITDPHAIMDAYKDRDLGRVFKALGMTTPGGMAIGWLLKLRGHRDARGHYGPDVMLETCRAGLGHGYRHSLYGSAEGVATTLADKLRAQLLGLGIAGTHTPPLRDLTESEGRSVEDLAAGEGSRASRSWVGGTADRCSLDWMAKAASATDQAAMYGAQPTPEKIDEGRWATLVNV